MPTSDPLPPLERALAFIESLTVDPWLMGDDIEMLPGDVRKHAAIELASIRLAILEARKPVEFGAGKMVIDTGTYCEAPAVFVAPASMPGEVGTSAKREGHPTDKLVYGEIVMTFPTDAQAQLVADALCGTLTAAEGVKPRVKPLEWDGFRSGPYFIEVCEGGIATLYNNADCHEDGEPGCMKSGYLTLISLDDLKAIAQADYEARILSALQEGE